MTRDQRQRRVFDWVVETFGSANANVQERTRRLLEEAIELAQAEGLSLVEILNLAEHVYGKPPGAPAQEAGGIGATLLAYCEAKGLSADGCEDAEVQRVLGMDQSYFRRRHNRKAQAGVADFVLDEAKCASCGRSRDAHEDGFAGPGRCLGFRWCDYDADSDDDGEVDESAFTPVEWIPGVGLVKKGPK